MTQKYCHLHLHTHHSFLDGCMKPEDLFKQCENHGMTKVGVTNHGNMVNMPEMVLEGRKRGIQVIPGCELYVTWDYSRHVKEKEKYQAYHMIAVAKNQKGYQNLLKLVTEGEMSGKYKKPRVDRELIEQYKEGLIFTTACLNGILNRKFAKEDVNKDEIFQSAKVLKEMLDGQIYFEIQRHPGLEKQDEANAMLLDFAKKLDVPVVAGCDAHYAYPEHHKAWCTMMTLAMPGINFDAPNDYYMKSGEEMLELYKDMPDTVTRTMEIADQCEPIEFDGSYKFPVFDTGKLSEKEYLKKDCLRGLELRIAENGLGKQRKEYEERLEMELNVIDRMGFNGYMLVVADFINFAKQNNIPVGPGRGSAAGSLVCWATGITEVDPIRYGLLFERFLNPDRISMPDIDMDFADDDRYKVKQYAEKKYGKDKVASIMTVGTMAAKGALRDCCRVVGVSYADTDALAKKVPEGVRGKNVYLRTITDKKHEDYCPEFMDFVATKPEYKEALDRALILEGMIRNSGVHAAGVVISDDKPLVEYTSLALDKEGNIITHNTMGVLEKVLGLIKFDFLGLKTLTTNKKACEFIKNNHDIDIDLDKIPMDDPKVFDTLKKGDLVGIFQLTGSSGFKDVTMQVQPESIEDTADITSLYRPGPLDNGFIPKYVKAKRTGKIEYMIKVANPEIQNKIEEVLLPTKGVIIYQEQVMELVRIMGGYTLAQADLLRRAMGKKVAEEMEAQRKIFIEGCAKNKIDKKSASDAFDAIAKFAEYGFNKSHAIAYSIISYQTAYLKTYYPSEFMAASLSEVAGDRDKTIAFLNDCKAHEIRILPPSVNESELAYTPVKEGIRFGLGAVKSLGDVAVNSILNAKNKGGRFKNILDFCSRVDLQKVNTAKIQTLIKAGCMDDLVA